MAAFKCIRAFATKGMSNEVEKITVLEWLGFQQILESIQFAHRDWNENINYDEYESDVDFLEIVAITIFELGQWGLTLY